ncbi:hypothetical protein M0R45_006666 [Rubus argutus]|uniref:Uncharacterized protein n=1 Tax=Rubus argutus TaxID=59490 RepID=A0AAW1YRI5_RUBAR
MEAQKLQSSISHGFNPKPNPKQRITASVLHSHHLRLITSPCSPPPPLSHLAATTRALLRSISSKPTPHPGVAPPGHRRHKAVAASTNPDPSPCSSLLRRSRSHAVDLTAPQILAAAQP